jgi:hypothetical protein
VVSFHVSSGTSESFRHVEHSGREEWGKPSKLDTFHLPGCCQNRAACDAGGACGVCVGAQMAQLLAGNHGPSTDEMLDKEKHP